MLDMLRAACLAAGVAAALTRPALAASLDALDPFDPVGSDAWLGPLVPTALYTRAEPPTRGRGPWLGIGAGLASSPGERRRLFALIELGIPLDDLAGSGGAPALDAADGVDASVASDAVDAPDSGQAAARERLGERSAIADRRVAVAENRDSPKSPGWPPASPIAAAGGEPRAPGPFDAGPATSLAPARNALAGPLAVRPPASRSAPGCNSRSCDPATLMHLARAAVAEALRVQGGQAELRRLDGMAARSRAAASLPEVRLGAGTSRDESLRLAPTAADPARFTRDGGRDLWLEARLTWRLDSAIFARDEIAIMRLRAQQREAAARLAADVLEALVALERARLRLASDLSSADERDQAMVIQFGALARLDVLTEGWFSRQLERARRAGREHWP